MVTGGDAPHWSDVTASSWAGVERASIPFSRVPSSSFEGVSPDPYESGYHSVTELTPALPHSGGDGLTGRVGGTAPGHNSQACQSIKCPLSGEQVRGRRACEVLERGGTSPEGATGPRARRNLTRGGARPSSEAEIRWCDATPLERSGVPPEGGWADCSGGPLGPPAPWALPVIRDCFSRVLRW
jgi:hypothetical protein